MGARAIEAGASRLVRAGGEKQASIGAEKIKG